MKFTVPSILLALGMAQANTSVTANFDAFPAGNLTLAQIKTEWPGVTWEDGLAEGRVQVLGDAGQSNQGVRVTYPQGAFGPSQGGAQWLATFGGTADTLSSSYWVRPSLDFDFVKGGKLPGLCGSQCNTGGNIPNGSDGWSARMMWRTGGAVVLYLYYPDQPGTYAVDFPLELQGNPVTFTPGEWSQISTQVRLNTPGQKDGSVKVWFNGELALNQQGLRLRDQDSMHVNRFYFSTFHGGSDATWAPAHACTMDFDSFWIGSDDPAAVPVHLPQPNSHSLKAERGMVLLPPSSTPWSITWRNALGQVTLQQNLPARAGQVKIPADAVMGDLVTGDSAFRWTR